MNGAVIPTAISYMQKRGKWFILGLLGVIFVSTAIANSNLKNLGILLVPFLIYCSMKKPFIFPFGVYVFLLPFEGVLQSSSGATLNKVLGLLSILVLFLKAVFEKKLKRPNNIVIWWTLFCSFCALSIVWAIQQEATFAELITAISLLLLYLVTVSYKIEKREYDVLKWFIFAGGFVAALFLIYDYLTGSFISKYHMRTSIKLAGRGLSVDAQGFYLLFPISVGISLILEQKKQIMKILMLIITFITIMGVIANGTRGSLVAICVILIAYLLFMKNKTSLGVMLLIGVAIIIPLTPEHIVYRITAAAHDGGSGRLSIWMVGLKSLKTYWLLGAGFNNFPLAYNNFIDEWSYGFHGLSSAPHNIFLGTFVELGIVGFTLLIIVLMRHYQAISSGFLPNNNDQIMLKATFWGLLTQSFFIDTLWYKSFWLLWMMILMYRNAVVGVYRYRS